MEGICVHILGSKERHEIYFSRTLHRAVRGVTRNASKKKRLKVTPKNAHHDKFSGGRDSCMQSIKADLSLGIHHNPPTMIDLSQSHQWNKRDHA
jgi:hypothetical protein